MAAVLIIMLMTPGMAISVWLIPVWLLILASATCVKKNGKNGESPLIVALLFRPPVRGGCYLPHSFPRITILSISAA